MWSSSRPANRRFNGLMTPAPRNAAWVQLEERPFGLRTFDRRQQPAVMDERVSIRFAPKV